MGKEVEKTGAFSSPRAPVGCWKVVAGETFETSLDLRPPCVIPVTGRASGSPPFGLPASQSSHLPEAEAPSVPLVVQALGCNYRLGLRVLVACADAAASLLHRIDTMEGDASALAQAARLRSK